MQGSAFPHSFQQSCGVRPHHKSLLNPATIGLSMLEAIASRLEAIGLTMFANITMLRTWPCCGTATIFPEMRTLPPCEWHILKARQATKSKHDAKERMSLLIQLITIASFLWYYQSVRHANICLASTPTLYPADERNLGLPSHCLCIVCTAADWRECTSFYQP